MSISYNLPIITKSPIEADQASLANSAQTEFKFVDSNFSTVAKASLWCENLPEFKGEKIAYVGKYSANSVALGVELLHTIAEHAKSQGLTYLIGPIDGNTWSNYRLVTKGFDSEPFALENMTAKELPWHFLTAGFKSIATYKSTLVDTNPQLVNSSKFNSFKNRSKIEISSFNKKDPSQNLEAMYELSIAGFKNNFLYSPISKTEFLQKYEQIVPLVDSDLVLIARENGKAVGFIFALPNKHLAQGRDDTVVIKTLVRLPNKEYQGLGLNLVSLIHSKAHEKGYQKVIHALYKEDNRSSSFSKNETARDLREYSLYGKKL